MMETAEQPDAVEVVYDEPDLDFASCPREDDEPEELNPPYEILLEAQASSPDRMDQDTELEAAEVAALSTTDRGAEAERLASLRVHTEDRDRSVPRGQQVSSPGSRVADSRSGTGGEDVAGQLQQLVSVVGVLATRLERIEAASGSDASSGSQWRPRSDTVNLGYVDHTALDRWYNQAVQEWTGPAGDIGGGPSMSAPGPTSGSGCEIPNPWFSGPAGWFRQFGSWMGPWGLGGQGRGQPQDAHLPPLPGQALGTLPAQDPGQVTHMPQGPGQVSHVPQGPGQVPHALQGPGQVSHVPQGPGQVPHALQGPGQVPHVPQGPGQVPHALQGPGQVPHVPQGRGQVPHAMQGPGQVPHALQGPGQVPHAMQGPVQVPHPLQGSGQVPRALPGLGQVPHTLQGPGQVPHAMQALGQVIGAHMGPQTGLPNSGGGSSGQDNPSQRHTDTTSRPRVLSVRATQAQEEHLQMQGGPGSRPDGLRQSRGLASDDRAQLGLVPGSRVQVIVEGHSKEAIVNAQGGLELAPDQFYIGSLRGTSLSPPRDHEAPPPPVGTPPRTPRLGYSTPRNPVTPGGTPVPATPAPADASPASGRGLHSSLRPEEPARHVTELPPLSEPKHRSQGAVLAGDWVVAITPSMIQLSASAQEWWSINVRDAREQYSMWLEKTPQERLKIKAEHLPRRWVTGKFALVEQRGVSLLMKALPEGFRDQLVSSRLLHTSAILFQIYCRWQPGGALEKSQLLEFLVTPDPASTAVEAAEGIRKWQRLCRRGHELDTVLPDPSLLLRGLDVLTGQFLQGHNVVNFRVAAYRNDTGVDYAPTSTTVAELAEFLLAECETLAIAEDPKAPPTKRPRAARAKADPSAPTTNPKAGAPSSPNPKASAATPTPCRDWGTAKGCKKGANCGFQHDRQVLKGARRCWNCSAEDHLKPTCPYLPPEPASEDHSKEQSEPKARSGDQGGGKGKSGHKGGGKAKAKATAEVRKAQPADQAESGPHSAAQPDSSTRSSAQEEFLKECTDMVRSLKLKALRSPMTLNRVSHEPLGLLDTGATASMRRGTTNELARCPRKAISLAVGEVTLAVSEEGTLLTEGDVEPLVCVADLVSLGCKLVWEDGGCYLDHPRRGRIVTRTHNRCPEVDVQTALHLITDIEVHKRQIAASVTKVRRAVLAAAMQTKAELSARLVEAVKEDSNIGPVLGAWLTAHYPEVPSEVIEAIAVNSDGDVAHSPWNRRKRRSCLRKGAFLHLFAGSCRGRPFKRATEPYELLEIDVEEDITASGAWAFVLRLAVSQQLRGVFGGPPCRTHSLCRHFGPGPRPLRAPGHWHGLPGLNPYERQQVLYDDGLVVRMLALYEISCFVSELEPFFGLEQPADPASFMPDPKPEDVDPRVREAIGINLHDAPTSVSARKVYSCLWRSPLWNSFEARHRIRRASFDQGPLGHEKRKPTCLAANVEIPQELSLSCGPGTAPGGGTGPHISGQWARWAPGFVSGLCLMISTCVAFQARASALPEDTVRAVRDTAFEQHVRNDHQPWRRDCEHCVAGGLQGRLHKRVSCPEGYALSLDLLGRYEPAPSELHKTVNWCLVGCFVVPQLSVREGGLDDDVHEDGASPVLPHKGVDLNPGSSTDPPEHLVVESSTSYRVVDTNPHATTASASGGVPDPSGIPAESDHWHDSDLDGYAPSEIGAEVPSLPLPAMCPDPPRSISPPDDPNEEAAMQEEWQRKVSDLKLSSSPMHELHFVVPIPNKTETSVLDAVALVLTQIQALGYQCIRVHSDKGREFANKRLRNFLRLRGIYKTTSEGDDYKGNGRIEGAIRRLKQQARVLLHASNMDHQYWAFALQHAAARQRANMMPRLGGATQTLLPSGARVFVRRRTWDQKHKRWEARGIQATVLSPSLEVTRGHVVLLATGELMTTSTLLTMKPRVSDASAADAPLEEPTVPVVEPAVDPPPAVHHRITSKRRVMAALRDDLQQEDLHARNLSDSPAFDSAKAVDFLLNSKWLTKATSPSQRSILVGGSSHVFGLFRHGGVIGLTAETTRYTGFLRLLHSLVRAAAPSFQYTSLTLLSQVKSLPHRDLGNVPGTYSLLLPLAMPPTGGHLWVEDPDGNLEYELPSGRSCWGRHVPLSPLQPVRVDPNKYHATQDWEAGTRLVLVAYHLRALARASLPLQSSLQQLDFPLPALPSHAPANTVSCQGGVRMVMGREN